MDLDSESEPIKESPPDNRSLDEKLADKNWKTRVAAYEELSQQLKSTLGDDPIFNEYAPLIPKIVSDINASALDAGLAVATQFVDQLPEESVSSFAQRFGSAVTASVVDKALSGRTTVQAKGKALLLKLMEVDEPSTSTAVLLDKLFVKKPKIPPMCLDIIKEGIGLFGAKAFPIRDIIAKMGEVMNKGTSDSRTAAMSLMLEITRWIGVAPFAAVLDTIKPVQKAEFETLYAARDSDESKPKPSLYLRKDRAAATLAESSVPSSSARGVGANNSTEQQQSEDDDAREYVQEVDLVKVLKASEYSKLVAEEKWSEQLKGLQLVIEAIGPTPKIKPGSDVYEIVQVCKGFLRAGHLSLQQSSLKIISLLSDGLRSDFTNTLRPVLQLVITKCKEKRLLTDVKAVLRAAVMHCVSYDVLSDDLSELVKSKKTPPHARLCLMESAVDVLSTCSDKVSSDSLKAIADMLTCSCEDSDPKVREMCVKSFVVLADVVKSRGRSAIDAHKMITKLEQSVPKVHKRIQAMKEGGVSTSATTSRPGLAKPASSSAVPAKKVAPPSALSKSKSVSTAGKSAGSTTNNKMKSVAAASSSPPPGAVEDDSSVEEVMMSPEDAEEKLTEMNITEWSKIQTLIASSKWQDRVEALELLEKHIDVNEAGAAMCVPMTSFLKNQFPKLKSTNMTIIKAIMQLYTTCANRTGAGSFSKSVTLEIIQAWGDKFSDKKGKDSFGALLTVMSAAVSPSFCVKQMKRVMDKTKAPLGHQAYLEWLKSTVSEFGAATLPVQHIVSFLHVELENKVAGVRTGAVEVLGALYHQLGPRFLSIAMADTLKPAVKTILEAEFEKVGYDATAQPSRAVKSQAEGVSKGEGFSVPRTDLSAALDRSTISGLAMTEGKNSWQTRKSAMEAVIEACDRSGHFIEGNAAVKQVLKSLKARLNDTQANLKPMGALSLGHVLSSLDGESCHKFLKPLASSLLSGIADNKKSMRDAVVAALQMIVTLNKEGGVADATLIGTLLASAVEAVVNPVGREELLTFFLVHVQSEVVIKTDCSEIAPSLVVALQDKVAATRALAEQVMTALVAKGYLSRLTVEKSFRSLPPAALRSLQAPKDRILSAPGTGASSVNTESKKLQAEEETVDSVQTVKKMTRLPNKGAVSSKQVAPPISTNTPAAAADVSSASVNPYFPLKKTNKAKRLDDYYKSNWPQPPEDPSEHERAALRAAWEPLLDRTLFEILFPDKTAGLTNQDSVMGAVAELLSILNDEPTGATSGCTLGPKCGEMVIQHTDLMIKWVALALCMRESSNGLLKLLLLVATIFNKIKNVPNMQLHEGEIVCILPALIDKSGHKSERHKFGFKHAINACTPIVSSNRLCQLLLSGLTCKNKKTRVVCIEEIDRIVEVSGPSSLGKVGIREIGITLNNKDTDVGVRNAALDFCFTLYMTIGYDRKKLTKLLGDISERAIPMIDHRIKEKMKTQGGPPPSDDSQPPEGESKRTRGASTTATVASASISVGNRPSAVPTSIPATSTPVPAKKTSAFSLEDDDVAFRLDMTPPEAEDQDRDRFASSTEGLAQNMDESSFPPPPPTPATSSGSLAEVNGVYADILSAMDAMLSLSAGSFSAELIQAAKDHLKMLHTIIVAPSASDTGNQAHDVLQRNAPTLLNKLCQCIDFGFQIQSMKQQPVAVQSSNLSDLVDVGLISVCLACMFALLDCKDLLRNVDEVRVTQMISTGIKWLVDTRFFPSEGSSLAPKVEQDLSKALNAFLIKIGSSHPFKNGVVMCAIIDVLSLCIEEKGLAASVSLPSACARPLSRLLLKVLSNEATRGSTKAFHLPNVDTMRLMSVLHSFFNSHPSTVPSNDVPYCCAKTVFAQLIEALGSAEVDRLCHVLKIPDTAFIFRLAKRLHPTCTSTDASHSPESSRAQLQSPLVPALVNMVNTITTSRDKAGAIRQLQALLEQHPGEDVDRYLCHTSSTFRRFVTDTLASLPSSSAHGSGASSSPTPASKSEDGREALRILEGLKSTSKRSVLASPPPLSENSTGVERSSVGSHSVNRSLIKDNVMGHLSSVTESLSVSSAGSSSGFGADSDLAARLARLKRMESGS